VFPKLLFLSFLSSFVSCVLEWEKRLCIHLIFHNSTAPIESGLPHFRGFEITLSKTQHALDEWSASRRGFCLTTHNTRKRQISMPPAGFKPEIPASERPQTHALSTASLVPEPTQHSKPTFVWAYIARHVWLLLIRHICPDFYRENNFFLLSRLIVCDVNVTRFTHLIMVGTNFCPWTVTFAVLYANSLVLFFPYLPGKFNFSRI
jgi:hypothetical protein